VALIRARHEVFGVCRVPEGAVRLFPDEWEPLDGPLPQLPGRRSPTKTSSPAPVEDPAPTPESQED
jgi:hypothetical protein